MDHPLRANENPSATDGMCAKGCRLLGLGLGLPTLAVNHSSCWGNTWLIKQSTDFWSISHCIIDLESISHCIQIALDMCTVFKQATTFLWQNNLYDPNQSTLLKQLLSDRSLKRNSSCFICFWQYLTVSHHIPFYILSNITITNHWQYLTVSYDIPFCILSNMPITGISHSLGGC